MSVSGMPIRPTPFAWSAFSLFLLAVLVGCGRRGSGDSDSPLLLTGTIEWGTEGGMFFQSCGSEILVPMTDPEGLLENVRSFASVYASGSEQIGWTVSRINYVPSEGFNCDFEWTDTMWRAAGNEPFWSASLEEDGLVIRAASEIRTSPVQVDGLSFISERDNVELHLTQGLCQDTMADTQYGYVAQLSVEGVSFSGCAFQGLGAKEAR